MVVAESEPYTVMYQLAISIFVALFLIEIIELLTGKIKGKDNNNPVVEKSKLLHKLLIILIGFFMVEATYRLEVTALTKYNEVSSIQVNGIKEYTLYFVIIAAFIEEIIKFVVMAIAVKKYGYKKIYHTIGIVSVFAAWEHFYNIIVFPNSELSTNVMERRFELGIQWIHIGIGFFALSIIIIVNEIEILNQYPIKIPVYTMTFFAGLWFHSYYNYITFLSAFGFYDKDLPQQIAWVFGVMSVLFWSIVATRINNKEIE